MACASRHFAEEQQFALDGRLYYVQPPPPRRVTRYIEEDSPDGRLGWRILDISSADVHESPAAVLLTRAGARYIAEIAREQASV